MGFIVFFFLVCVDFSHLLSRSMTTMSGLCCDYSWWPMFSSFASDENSVMHIFKSSITILTHMEKHRRAFLFLSWMQDTAFIEMPFLPGWLPLGCRKNFPLWVILIGSHTAFVWPLRWRALIPIFIETNPSQWFPSCSPAVMLNSLETYIALPTSSGS